MGVLHWLAAMRGPGPGLPPLARGSALFNVTQDQETGESLPGAAAEEVEQGAVSAGLGPTVVIIGLRWPPGTLGNNDQYGTHLTFALGDFTLGSR